MTNRFSQNERFFIWYEMKRNNFKIQILYSHIYQLLNDVNQIHYFGYLKILIKENEFTLMRSVNNCESFVDSNVVTYCQEK